MSSPNNGCTIVLGSEIDELAMGGRTQPLYDPRTHACTGEGTWRITGVPQTRHNYACDIHAEGWRRYGATAVSVDFVIEEF